MQPSNVVQLWKHCMKRSNVSNKINETHYRQQNKSTALQDINRFIFTCHFLSHSFPYQTSKFQIHFHIFIQLSFLKLFNVCLAAWKIHFIQIRRVIYRKWAKSAPFIINFSSHTAQAHWLSKNSCYNKTYTVKCISTLLSIVFIIC